MLDPILIDVNLRRINYCWPSSPTACSTYITVTRQLELAALDTEKIHASFLKLPQLGLSLYILCQ
jgi:hypothetical protein